MNHHHLGYCRRTVVYLSLALFVAAFWVACATSVRAVAVSVTESPCPHIYKRAHSVTADYCRDDGWVVTKHLSIGPLNRRAWTDLPPCESEDSARCYWNARTMGNGEGRSFIDHSPLGTFFGMHRINGTRS